MNSRSFIRIFMMMKKIILIFLFAFLFATAFNSVAQNKTSTKTRSSKTSRPPNIIIILADDMGYGDLGCYGHPTIRTPHLDSMAQQGMRFTQFYVGANVCTPSRAALLTGRLPIRYGVAGSYDSPVFFPNSANGLPPSEITIAEALKTKQYATAIIGKWHLGHLPKFLPTNHGFDYYFGIPYSNDMNSDRGWPALPLFRNTEVIDTNPDQSQLTKRYTAESISFIKKNKDKPFFLYYPNNFPHVPLHASKDFAGKSKRGLYGDVVSELDWSVGEILNALHEQQLDKNTLVIFLSDNGPWLKQKENGGSAGLLFEGKGSAYEGGMRIPAIAWWPGVIAPWQTCEALAASMDLMPTILKLAGIPLPTDRVYDGEDIMPLLTGQKKTVRDTLFYYHRYELYAVRKGQWKAHFITRPSDPTDAQPTMHDTPVLFNIENDPSEKYDVSKAHPEMIKELKSIYEKQKVSINAPPQLTDSIYWEKGSPPLNWWRGKQ